MRIRLCRLLPGQSRFYFGQNITDRIDRECCGGWYLNIHCYPFFFECYQTR